MPEIIPCPKCSRRLRLPEQHVGAMVRCPACGTDFQAAAAAPVLEEIVLTVEPLPLSDLPRPLSGKHMQRAKQKPPHVRTGVLISGLVAFGVIVVLTLGLVLLSDTDWFQPRNNRLDLGRAKIKFPEVQDPDTPAQLKAAAQAIFSRMRTHINNQDDDPIAVLFDLNRTYDDFVNAINAPAVNGMRRYAFKFAVTHGIRQIVSQNRHLEKWGEFEIQKAELIDDTEGVVILRHLVAETGDVLHSRWWLSRQSGKWLIYDMEDLDCGLPMSALVAYLYLPADAAQLPRIRALKALHDARMAIARVERDLDTAAKKLKEVEHIPLPKKWEANRHVLTALVELGHGQTAQGLESLGKASLAQPNTPVVDFLKGIGLNALGRHQEALIRLEAYRNLLGEDASLCQEIGDAYRGLYKFPAAAKAYRIALSVQFKRPELVSRFAVVHRSRKPGGHQGNQGTIRDTQRSQSEF